MFREALLRVAFSLFSLSLSMPLTRCLALISFACASPFVLGVSAFVLVPPLVRVQTRASYISVSCVLRSF